MSDYTYFDFSDDEEDCIPSYTTWVSVIKEFDGDPILDEAPARSSRTSSEDYYSLFYADQEVSSSGDELPYPTLWRAEEEEEDCPTLDEATASSSSEDYFRLFYADQEVSFSDNELPYPTLRRAEEEEDWLETSSLMSEEEIRFHLPQNRASALHLDREDHLVSSIRTTKQSFCAPPRSRRPPFRRSSRGFHLPPLPPSSTFTVPERSCSCTLVYSAYYTSCPLAILYL